MPVGLAQEVVQEVVAVEEEEEGTGKVEVEVVVATRVTITSGSLMRLLATLA